MVRKSICLKICFWGWCRKIYSATQRRSLAGRSRQLDARTRTMSKKKTHAVMPAAGGFRLLPTPYSCRMLLGILPSHKLRKLQLDVQR